MGRISSLGRASTALAPARRPEPDCILGASRDKTQENPQRAIGLLEYRYFYLDKERRLELKPSAARNSVKALA
jgi:hypothetical protein